MDQMDLDKEDQQHFLPPGFSGPPGGDFDHLHLREIQKLAASISNN